MLTQKVREKSGDNLERLEFFNSITVRRLASSMMREKDVYTRFHQARVAALAECIARKLGMTEKEVKHIKTAAELHDVGKVSIPLDVLHKGANQPLTKADWELIGKHPQTGFRILKDLAPTPITEMILQHHERLDGQGYPAGLTSEQILPGAKILSISDTFDAITSNRPYRLGLALEFALEELERCQGTRYDPDVVKTCLQICLENFSGNWQ